MALQFELSDDMTEEIMNNINTLYQTTLEQARRDAGVLKEFLTIPEALKYMNISRNTFTENVLKQGLPQYTIGSKVYVKRSELNKFIEERRI